MNRLKCVDAFSAMPGVNLSLGVVFCDSFPSLPFPLHNNTSPIPDGSIGREGCMAQSLIL